MTTAHSPAPGVGDSPRDDGAESIDLALVRAVETITSRRYQEGNPAFSPLNLRDAVLIGVLYVLIPALFALAVGLS